MTTNQSNWEIEFKDMKFFHNHDCSAFCNSECNQAHTHFDEQDCDCVRSKMKDFIRTLLAEQRERMMGQVKIIMEMNEISGDRLMQSENPMWVKDRTIAEVQNKILLEVLKYIKIETISVPDSGAVRVYGHLNLIRYENFKN